MFEPLARTRGPPEGALNEDRTESLSVVRQSFNDLTILIFAARKYLFLKAREGVSFSIILSFFLLFHFRLAYGGAAAGGGHAAVLAAHGLPDVLVERQIWSGVFAAEVKF